MSALENGLFFHHVLHQFYTSRLFPISQRHRLQPIVMDSSKKEEYRKELHEIAQREFRMIDFQHPFMEIERQTIFGDAKRGIKVDWTCGLKWNGTICKVPNINQLFSKLDLETKKIKSLQ
jgi:hypothetical protein